MVVGLGNPGAEYVRTRHNAGFLLADNLAGKFRTGWGFERKFQAEVAMVRVAGVRVLLCKPQTYMNASGESVSALMDYYQVPGTRLIVAVDDADLPLGELRLRGQGSPGGHHGLESIEQHLGTRDYPRLRLGIGRQVSGVRQITGHVLGRFAAAEWDLMVKVLDRASGQVLCWLEQGIEKAMNQFNGAIAVPEQKDKA